MITKEQFEVLKDNLTEAEGTADILYDINEQFVLPSYYIYRKHLHVVIATDLNKEQARNLTDELNSCEHEDDEIYGYKEWEK